MVCSSPGMRAEPTWREAASAPRPMLAALAGSAWLVRVTATASVGLRRAAGSRGFRQAAVPDAQGERAGFAAALVSAT
jgi:hypothetical protein